MNLPDRTLVSAIEAFRLSTGQEVCIKVFHCEGSQLSRLPKEYGLHGSSFCTNIKRTQNQACRQCDLLEVPARCWRDKDLFIHTCHAGAEEMILPLFIEGYLAGVCYVGQFRTKKGHTSEVPYMDARARRRLRGLAVLLAAYLTQLIQPRFATQTSGTYRGEMIRNFLIGRLKSNPGLPDLAQHLGVSISRASHIVSEATGASFLKLREQLRLERAKDLLAQTYSKVSHVAAECGFEDPHYFHRFFRKQTGMTPAVFRRGCRPEA